MLGENNYTYKLVCKEAENGEEWEISLTKEFNKKDAVLQMLLHLNEDFDDDLLLDAVNLLLMGSWLWHSNHINITSNRE